MPRKPKTPRIPIAMTKAGACDALGVDHYDSSFARAVDAGELVGYYVGVRKLYIVRDIEAWIREQPTVRKKRGPKPKQSATEEITS
jgi:hypothetical protein